MNMDDFSEIGMDQKPAGFAEHNKSKKYNLHELGILLNNVVVRRSPRSPYLRQPYKKVISIFLLVIALGIYCMFAIMISGFQKCIGLFIFLIVTTIILLYIVIRDYFGKQIKILLISPIKRKIEENWRILKWYVESK